MSLPLQLVLAEPSIPVAGGDARFVWDDQPEPARRAARQARALLEATGARGEGGFVRVIVGDVAIALEPAPIVTLWVTLGELRAHALAVPEHIGPRVLDAATRRAVAATLVELIVDIAATDAARDALTQLARACEDGALALGAVARFAAKSLAEALAERLAAQVATRVAEARGRAAALSAPAWPALEVDAREAEVLGARVAADGPALARERAAAALDVADVYAERVRRALDQALATHGFGAVSAARQLIAELRREVATRLPTPAPIVPLEAPARAALAAAEHAFGELAHDVHAWPLEAAGALGGGVVAAVALGPFVDVALPGGGWTLVAGCTTGLWIVAALGTRLAQAVARRLAARTRDDAEAALADAWKAAARRWFAPIAQAATRRALLRLDRALAQELARLEALEAEVDALVRRPIVPKNGTIGPGPLALAVDLGSAAQVLARPVEPLFRRVEAELKGLGWRAERPILGAPDGLLQAARVAYAELAAQLPLTTRTDVADALREPTRASLAALRDELARWLPDGVPARRFIALPRALSGARPDSARFDEPLVSGGDAWLLALWRPT